LEFDIEETLLVIYLFCCSFQFVTDVYQKYTAALPLPHTQQEDVVETMEIMDNMVLVGMLMLSVLMSGLFTLLYIKTRKEKRMSQARIYF
jgi:hypothetical protein